MFRPRIALPEIDQDVRNYTRAIYAAGMEPIVISVESDQLQNGWQQEYLDHAQYQIDRYDGLILPGGCDINPKRYGQKDEGQCLSVMDAMDELQLCILDDFVRGGKPVLGICRGHQLINVYFGGTLIQHLPTAFRHFREPDSPTDKQHWGRNREGSWLESIYGQTFSHNSSHHQAVEQLGKGLAADSWCPEDGVVEAMHHESLPIYSVQWHPERMCLNHTRDDTVNGLPLLQFFCRQCGGDPQSYDELMRSWIMDGRMGI